ncbi:MAG: cysteine hydrolase [Streptococcaceae bacterium]|nr:cysteine hydrolase [Streptococcaceae bacterium]MCL2681223.1 cysteine hydrolase [Streptococcaceae bacterium]MCL2858144.1 cysteine hydrolase [Streptococcaceae bacterium]
MKKALVLIDFQNDFINGSLGTKEAQIIVSSVLDKLTHYHDGALLATQDTHLENYLQTQEGKNLPILHCQKGSKGWEIHPQAQLFVYEKIFEKSTFASVELAEYIQNQEFEQVELIGLCTDICVVSNALLIKAYAPEIEIFIDASCCAGTTLEAHSSALDTMASCQIKIFNQQ